MKFPPIIVDLIKQVVTLIATVLFLRIIGQFPTFPIPQEMFIKLLIWAVLSILGIKAVVEYVHNKMRGE